MVRDRVPDTKALQRVICSLPPRLDWPMPYLLGFQGVTLGRERARTADFLHTFTDAADDMQLFWEAFPAEGGAARTTYMFTYCDTDRQRPTFQARPPDPAPGSITLCARRPGPKPARGAERGGRVCGRAGRRAAPLERLAQGAAASGARAGRCWMAYGARARRCQSANYGGRTPGAAGPLLTGGACQALQERYSRRARGRRCWTATSSCCRSTRAHRWTRWISGACSSAPSRLSRTARCARSSTASCRCSTLNIPLSLCRRLRLHPALEAPCSASVRALDVLQATCAPPLP